MCYFFFSCRFCVKFTETLASCSSKVKCLQGCVSLSPDCFYHSVVCQQFADYGDYCGQILRVFKVAWCDNFTHFYHCNSHHKLSVSSKNKNIKADMIDAGLFVIQGWLCNCPLPVVVLRDSLFAAVFNYTSTVNFKCLNLISNHVWVRDGSYIFHSTLNPSVSHGRTCTWLKMSAYSHSSPPFFLFHVMSPPLPLVDPSHLTDFWIFHKQHN